MNNVLTPGDFGPLYTETDLTRLPVEPWNTFSNLIFLIIFIVFARKTKFKFSKHPLIVGILPILFIGWVGGTLYHGTRSNNIWLILDFVPIMVIALSGAVYLWKQVLSNIWVALLVTLLPFLLFRFVKNLLMLPSGLGISLGYIALALTIILPAIIQVYRTKGRNAWLVFGAFIVFAFAVTMRSLDKMQLLPMGTHFLWHILGGFSTALMLEFTLRIDLDRNSVVLSDPQ